MLFKDQYDFVKQHIKKNKLRVSMTILAATMGCAFLIILASIGYGLHKTVLNDILTNENVTSIELMNGQQLTDEDITKIEQLEHVQNVRTITRVSAEANSQLDDRDIQTELMMTNFKKYAAVNDELAEGSFPKADNEIVVGYHFAQHLLNDADREIIAQKSAEAEANNEWYDGAEEGYKQSLIGKKITMKVKSFTENSEYSESKTYTIVGVLPKPAYEWAIDTKIMLPEGNQQWLDTALTVGPGEEKFVDEMVIFATELEHVEGLLKTLRDDGYRLYSITEQLDEINVVYSIMKIGLVFVGAVAVLIASIGIFNTMTMAVTERTREIGVMKAIGASPKLIQRLFLMESLMIGVIGTVLALIISYAFSFTVNALMPFVVSEIFGQKDANLEGIILSYIPVQLVLIASTLSIGVAVLSGVRPARKATKIEVMQALRQEL
ncbi:FtsX-like permease family protein [Solibacillus sp. FSL R7-0682]|uniref:ABC transporter permease n=1 Tax=Solibacillus sp. FSL R7-0682 TaxID=2921690 RepID=UPI0030F53018